MPAISVTNASPPTLITKSKSTGSGSLATTDAGTNLDLLTY